jgi:uncharacterized protein (TIGR02147 family)
VIYEFKDYKKFINGLIHQMPKRGRGQARRLAEHLHVQPVVISQVFSGDRDLTPEQGLEVAAYFGLDERQAEYLVLLISQARAGTKKLSTHYEAKLEALRREAMKIKNSIVKHEVLSDPDKGIFYSNWYYSAVRLLTSTPGHDNIEAIAAKLDLSRAKTVEILDFLVSRGLCEEKNGRYKIGTSATFLDASSPFINGHRRNWHIKAMEKFADPKPHDIFYSSTASISEADQARVQQILTRVIKEFSKTVADSPAHKIACLNLDWFEL